MIVGYALGSILSGAPRLLLVSPLLAVLDARAIFDASAVAVPLIGLVALAVAIRLESRTRVV